MNKDETNVASLKKLVGAFNEAVYKWQAATGYQAVFGWGFDASGSRELRVQEIVDVIYIEPPSSEDMEEILSKFQSAAMNTPLGVSREH